MHCRAATTRGTSTAPPSSPSPGPYLAGIPVAELRQLDIVLTPHGFLKAALATNPLNAITQSFAGPSNDGLTGDGRKATIVSLMVLGKYRVNGTINDRNEVELVTTMIPTAFYGDTLYEFRYTEYKDFGGIRFPALVHVHTGDPTFNPAHNSMEIRMTDVKANVPMTAITVPDAVRTATVPPVRVATQQLAQGVWLVGGGSHNSVAVEFKDFVTVIEAPLDEERSLAVIQAVNKLVPNKPIRYIVNTHHHFDHSGGLRTYVCAGGDRPGDAGEPGSVSDRGVLPDPAHAAARPAGDLRADVHGEPPPGADGAGESGVCRQRWQPARSNCTRSPGIRTRWGC